LLGWFARGDRALRRFAPSEEPILWPEHFDLGIAADEINYGMSPGDVGHPLPYAYVGPWTPRRGLTGLSRHAAGSSCAAANETWNRSHQMLTLDRPVRSASAGIG